VSKKEHVQMDELLFSEKEPVQHRGGGKVNEERACDFVRSLRSAFGVEDQISRQVINYYQVMAVIETKLLILAC
jgi:hypothetical protein